MTSFPGSDAAEDAPDQRLLFGEIDPRRLEEGTEGRVFLDNPVDDLEAPAEHLDSLGSVGHLEEGERVVARDRLVSHASMSPSGRASWSR